MSGLKRCLPACYRCSRRQGRYCSLYVLDLGICQDEGRAYVNKALTYLVRAPIDSRPDAAEWFCDSLSEQLPQSNDVCATVSARDLGLFCVTTVNRIFHSQTCNSVFWSPM